MSRVESLRRLLDSLPDDAALRSAAVLVMSAGLADPDPAADDRPPATPRSSPIDDAQPV